MALTTNVQRALSFDPKTNTTKIVNVGDRTIFKAGLNDVQIKQLQALATKPQDQWTATDKKNWAFATGGGALPTASTSMTRISGVQYPTKEAQQAAFSNITPMGPEGRVFTSFGQPGSYLAGIPRDTRQLNLKDTTGGGYNLATSQLQTPQSQIQQPVISPAQSYHEAIANLLKQMQGGAGGLDEDLMRQRNALIQARFQAQADITPEALRVLSPEQQTALRGQDVRGLETQLGGVAAALKSREAQRTEARNFLSEFNKQFEPREVGGQMIQLNPETGKYDVVYEGTKQDTEAQKRIDKMATLLFQNMSNYSDLTPEDQQQLADSMNMSVESLINMGATARNQLALDKFAQSQKENQFEESMKLAQLALKTPKGTTVVVGGTSVQGTFVPKARGSKGSTSTDKAFWAAIDKGKTELQQGENWGNVFNRIKIQFPNADNNTIDQALGVSWREPGAAERFKAKGKTTSGRTR